MFASIHTIQAFHSAFNAFIQLSQYYEALHNEPKTHTQIDSPGATSLRTTPIRLHRNNMPPKPNSYKKLHKHPHREGFEQAIQTEIHILKGMNTWTEIPPDHAIKQNKMPIPTRWVFKYKFNNQGYFLKYRAQLCAHGNLQYTETDTYTATLTSRIFRVLTAITAAFDLKTRQYNAINAFANSQIDEPTYCYLPEGFQHSQKTLLLLNRALYNLKQSPTL